MGVVVLIIIGLYDFLQQLSVLSSGSCRTVTGQSVTQYHTNRPTASI